MHVCICRSSHTYFTNTIQFCHSFHPSIMLCCVLPKESVQNQEVDCNLYSHSVGTRHCFHVTYSIGNPTSKIICFEAFVISMFSLPSIVLVHVGLKSIRWYSSSSFHSQFFWLSTFSYLSVFVPPLAVFDQIHQQRTKTILTLFRKERSVVVICICFDIWWLFYRFFLEDGLLCMCYYPSKTSFWSIQF